MRTLCASVLLIAAIGLTAHAEEDVPGGELEKGRWVGHIEFAGRAEAFATTLDLYVLQPDDVTLFPRLEAILKTSLGGYSGGEYDSEHYQKVEYDFFSGVLTFDEPGTDLVVSALVYKSPHRIEGQVFSATTGQFGTLYLVYVDSDEPGDDDGPGDSPPTPSFAPSLAGQYEGLCGTKQAALQIETSRQNDVASDVAGLDHYEIRGALSMENDIVCNGLGIAGGPDWCVYSPYTSGSFSYFLGQLTLMGKFGADECQFSDGGILTCEVRVGDQNETCDLIKTNIESTPFFKAEPGFSVTTTAEQKQPLPEPSPPLHTDLLAALGGTFAGYLYHESKDQYQPMFLYVVASKSTENPHNENDVFVSPTAILRFGSSVSSDFWSHEFDRRPFFQGPGFTLHGDSSDAFLQITDWRKGTISGIWYSRAFGRVGRFQLVKSLVLPTISNQASFVPSIKGEFRGPKDRVGGVVDQWWFKTVVPVQTTSQSLLEFQGEHQMFTGSIWWPKHPLEGAYDVYAGQVNFLAEKGSENPVRVLGRYQTPEKINLFWPSAQTWGVGIFNYALDTYEREK
jgi:hypothetical protein